MKTAALKEVAPAQAARLSLKPKDVVWQLNLDQIEAQSGRVLSKVTGLASAAGSSTQSFDTGNVLYSKLRPYLNKVVCPDSPGIATTELVPLRPDPKKLDRQYLTYYLRSPEFVTWISNEVAGAKMPRVTMKVFWEHEIPLPPLAEQKRIAAILDAADALRTKRREALAQLDALLQSTFLTLFGDPVSNPMGWPKPPLLELCSAKQWPTISGPQLEKSGYPVYGANGQIGYYSKYNHEHPTVLVTCRGATCGTINICPPKCYVTGNAMALDDPDPKRITLTYLEWILRIRGMNDVICGAAQPQITRTGMAPITIPLPPLPLQQKFAAIVESVERQKAAQRAHLAELDALFAALQHRAFRGEL